MERAIINTNIRLNLHRPEDRRAWEYLQRLDRKKYKSYSRAVVAAVNDHFSRQERLAALLQSVRTAAPPSEPVMTDEDMDTAMDFINSL